MKKIQNFSAFTLIELLVVISIMVLISTAVIADYAGTRSSRDLKIAENQLVTNIRQAQSYSLSSRELPGGTPVDYYIMRFDTASSTRYQLQGMYNANSTPVYIQTSQTVNLPAGVALGNPVVNGTASPSGCALVAFVLPYAKILNNSSCTGGPPTVNASDDYQKFINFIVNNAATTVTSDTSVVLTLQNTAGSVYVLVNGTTGVICPTGGTGSTTCLSSY